MIDSKTLLADLRKLVAALEKDIRERTGAVPEIKAALEAEHAKAKKAERTAQTFNAWRDDYVTQVAVAWVLACVFVRFIEDNELIDHPWIAGPGDRMRDAQEQKLAFFRAPDRALLSDREYLEQVFREMMKVPTLDQFFDKKHNLVWHLAPSADGAASIIVFFQRVNTDTGALIHDFQDDEWDTRFLGDLYQDLSEATRKKYALLQTPGFVEEFILERTLGPAIETFGLKEVRMIDPTCGSGHLLIGAFRQLLGRWRQHEPGTSDIELVNRVLKAVNGVDINPYAAAIAKFRLLFEALKACQLTKLKQAPAFRINVAVGDSLLHGRSPKSGGLQTEFDLGDAKHAYTFENIDEVWGILSQHYHAVVGNPPYITVKDKALSAAYREIFGSCHRQYALVCPFMERFFQLAVPGSSGASAGSVGLIVSNSFMKREFGKKLIEDYIGNWDVTHVIDTSGAYIPGHGTPTVIILGRNQRPRSGTIRTALGIKGEPGAPAEPENGKVWRSIVDHLDQRGFENEFISISNTGRARLATHPWSLQGGGAAQLAEVIVSAASQLLTDVSKEVGFGVVTREDDVFLCDAPTSARLGIASAQVKVLTPGEEVRDWWNVARTFALWPYDPTTLEASVSVSAQHRLWRWRRQLQIRVAYGFSQLERGLEWYEYSMFFKNRYRTPFSIAFAFVATHNHFVLDRGGKVFNRSAPVIKLPVDATEDQHLELLGLLNSSTACFWMKQVFFCKGSTVDSRGARQTTVPFEDFWEHDGTKLKQFPIPAERPLTLARELDTLAQELAEVTPTALIKRATPTAPVLADAQRRYEAVRGRMIAMQEELDWQCYALYGLVNDECRVHEFPMSKEESVRDSSSCGSPSGIQLGERAFEIVLARKLAAGDSDTTWFARHGATPITELPAHWPDEYRELVERRIALIKADRNIRLIEQPEHKRRWAGDSWEQQVQQALQEWLLNRLEFALSGRDLLAEAGGISNDEYMNDESRRSRISADTKKPVLLSVARLADLVRADTDFMQVAELYTARPDFDVTKLVLELVQAESVPESVLFRCKESGRRKREDWETTWDLQRQEDRTHDEILAHICPNGSDTITLNQQAYQSYLAFATRSNRLRKGTTLDVWTAGNDVTLSAVHAPHLNCKTVAELADKIAWHLADEKIGEIPVPPKYANNDFAKPSYYQLRGKLDVPKERFVLYPQAERSADPTPVITWAGWNHLQRIVAMSAYYEDVKVREDWSEKRRAIFLATMLELLPWVKQWHGGIDPEFGEDMGDYFHEYLEGEARAIEYSLADLKELEP